MESFQQDDISFGCDESRCVSQGGWNHVSSDVTKPFANPFTCYGDNGTYYPKMCADGFVATTIEKEPTRMSADWYGNQDADIVVSYFTCCPPVHNTTERTKDNLIRQCSDPVILVENNLTCDNDSAGTTQTYPREMESSIMPNWKTYRPFFPFFTPLETTITKAFVCCENDLPFTADTNNNNTRNFLESTECVPYHSEYYDSYVLKNQIGRIVPIECEFKYLTFPYPHLSTTGKYECCREKSSNVLPPFVQDAAFNSTVYPLLLIWVVAASVSIILVISLLIPLLKEIRNPRNSAFQSSRLSSRTRGRTGFSTYNLYLVYMGGLDLAFSLFEIVRYSCCLNQIYYHDFIGGVIRPPSVVSPYDLIQDTNPEDNILGFSYVLGNVYINAIICHRILILLKASKNAKRIHPPSLTMVNLQCGAVIVSIVVYGLIFFNINEASKEVRADGNYERADAFLFVYGVLTCILIALPIGYALVLAVLMWWRGYMPPLLKKRNDNGGAEARMSVRDKAMRELAVYFSRIIGVFFAIWIPAGMLAFSVPWYAMAVEFLTAFQPILTFGLILTKSDVRQYILNVVTLSCLRKQNDSPTGRTTADPVQRNIFPANSAIAIPIGNVNDDSNNNNPDGSTNNNSCVNSDQANQVVASSGFAIPKGNANEDDNKNNPEESTNNDSCIKSDQTLYFYTPKPKKQIVSVSMTGDIGK